MFWLALMADDVSGRRKPRKKKRDPLRVQFSLLSRASSMRVTARKGVSLTSPGVFEAPHFHRNRKRVKEGKETVSSLLFPSGSKATNEERIKRGKDVIFTNPRLHFTLLLATHTTKKKKGKGTSIGLGSSPSTLLSRL